MEWKQTIKSYKPQIIFVLKILGIYFSLYLFINVFIGLTAEGGSFHSPWLNRNLNFVQGFRTLLLTISDLVLQLFGYETYRDNFHLGIEGMGGIRLVYSCLGFEVMFGYVALVLAYPYQGFRTWLYVMFGLVIFQVINVIRIVGLTVLYAHGNVALFDFIDHHDMFNIIAVICLIIVYRFFLRQTSVVSSVRFGLSRRNFCFRRSNKK